MASDGDVGMMKKALGLSLVAATISIAISLFLLTALLLSLLMMVFWHFLSAILILSAPNPKPVNL